MDNDMKRLPKPIPKVLLANDAMYWINVGAYIGIGLFVLSIVLSCPIMMFLTMLS